MAIQFLFLLAVCGAMSGALYATTKFGSALFLVPTILLFLPAFDLTATHLFLPVIATSLVSMIPMLLLDWLDQMKAQQVDSKYLIAFAPGAAMGGVIGAQLVSLMPFSAYWFASVIVYVSLLLNLCWQYRPLGETSTLGVFSHLPNNIMKLPVSLLLSCVSIMAASSSKPFYGSLFSLSSIKKDDIEPTVTGLALFAVTASTVGFAFPAQPLNTMAFNGFIGGIQFLACAVLALSQLIAFYLCRGRGSFLDIIVLRIAALAFLVMAGIRLMFW